MRRRNTLLCNDGLERVFVSLDVLCTAHRAFTNPPDKDTGAPMVTDRWKAEQEFVMHHAPANPLNKGGIKVVLHRIRDQDRLTT